jgi:site-specific DNA-methyltransferase (adenine-specific)
MEVQLHLGDCMEFMKGLADGSVDLAFIDLPYGLNVAKWDKELAGIEAIALARQKVAVGGSIYATISPHSLKALQEAVSYKRIIAWGKPNLPLRKNLKEWEWSTEFILWEVIGGTPRIFNKPHGEDARDYWRIPVENGFLRKDSYNHPARKPLALLRRIMDASTNAGDTVLDPFMGSGTTGAACVQSGRHFIGCEIDPDYFAMAEDRIAEAQAQIALAGEVAGSL